MKIRLCPKCGKQNDEGAWNCTDCGVTLSMNTIVDIGDLQSAQVAIAGKGVLTSVSPFFQDDLTELIKNNTRSSETIVKGCDICKPSVLPPFKFGYLIITSQQLILVCFDSDTESHIVGGRSPKRAWLNRWLGAFIDGSSARVGVDFCFVDRPTFALTEKEKGSREITSFPLGKLYLSELTNDVFLNLKVQHGDGISLDELSITFYFNDEAFEIYNLLTAWLKK